MRSSAPRIAVVCVSRVCPRRNRSTRWCRSRYGGSGYWHERGVMTVLAPLAAVLGLTIPAIIALYFLKIRRPTRVVPALHLWPSQIRDRQANVPWQRLRPSWLLFLQLLAAAALVAAAVQPVLPAGAPLAPPSILPLDAPPPLQATDLTPSPPAQ